MNVSTRHLFVQSGVLMAVPCKKASVTSLPFEAQVPDKFVPG